MALNFFVIFEGKEVDQGLEKSGFDDGRLVLRVDGYVPYTSSG